MQHLPVLLPRIKFVSQILKVRGKVVPVLLFT
jgi:hypothetical protein